MRGILVEEKIFETQRRGDAEEEKIFFVEEGRA